MSQFSGNILANTSRELLDLEQFIDLDREQVPRLSANGTAFGINQIDKLVLTTHKPLADEDDTEKNEFHYDLLLIRGFSKLVLLAERRAVADYVFFNVFRCLPAPRLRKVGVQIKSIVKNAELSSSEYLATSLAGRFAGSGENLKTMILYGNEVTASSVFKDQGDLFNFYSCGLGRRLFDGLPRNVHADQKEIIRIQNDGALTANISSRKSANEVISIIGHIIKNRWVDDWVPIDKDDS